MVAPIGFIKNIAVPKLLGGLTSHVPGKLCLLTTLHYSVSEALDDIQTVIETATGEAMERMVASFRELLTSLTLTDPTRTELCRY